MYSDRDRDHEAVLLFDQVPGNTMKSRQYESKPVTGNFNHKGSDQSPSLFCVLMSVGNDVIRHNMGTSRPVPSFLP
jgi:hypothetical protein